MRIQGINGKTVIITGSGSGIGRAIARRLAEEGASVVINDIDEEAAQETVALIADEGNEATTAVAHVTDLEAIRKMVSGVVEDEGQIDVLVNNAG